MRFVCAAAICLAAIPTLSGCSVTVSTPGGPPAAITLGAASNPTADMDRQIQAWGATGPKQAVQSIMQDGPPISDSLVNANFPLLGQQCASLLSDVQSAQRMPPPPDLILQNYWDDALEAYSQSANECESISASGVEDQGMISQFSTQVQYGNDSLRQFVDRLNSFQNGTAGPVAGP
jgi:hypothetical protein